MHLNTRRTKLVEESVANGSRRRHTSVPGKGPFLPSDFLISQGKFPAACGVQFGWPGQLVVRVRVETFHANRRSAGDTQIPVTSCALAMPCSRTRATHARVAYPGHPRIPRCGGVLYFGTRRGSRPYLQQPPRIPPIHARHIKLAAHGQPVGHGNEHRLDPRVGGKLAVELIDCAVGRRISQHGINHLSAS